MHRSAAQERQVRDLLAENADLKKFHEQIKREVRSILSRHDGNRGSAEDTMGSNRRVVLGRARATRAGDVGFAGSLKKQWTSLKQLIDTLEVQAAQADVISVTDHEKELTRMRQEMEDLREELEKSRELISQQQQLLQEQMLPKPGEGQPSPLWDAYFLEEQLRLQQDRAAFEEQKLAFQDEREKFTEAAIRLGRERMQFKADQALFLKQQFLNMTPGLETPPWKKTPPWSGLTNRTPSGTAQNSKRCFTPKWSCTGNSLHKRGSVQDPFTPSTAELYRVLRLAPPSRSTLMSERLKSRNKVYSDSEETRSDSLSPRSVSPEPQRSRPRRLSMTPYLRPRPTPGSVPRGHPDAQTPSTAELYRLLGMNPAGSVLPGHRKCDSALRKSVLHTHNRGRAYEGTPSVFCHENVKNSEPVCEYPHERTRGSYETDSLCSGDGGRPVGEDCDTPGLERRSCPRDASNCIDDDSLCKVSPLHRRSDVHPEEHQLRRDSLHCSGVPCLYVWPCNERSCVAENGHRAHLRETSRARDGYRSRSNEDLRHEDRNGSADDFPTGDRCHVFDNETRHHQSSLRSQSREPCFPRHNCRSLSREDRLPACSSRSRSRETLHPRDSCRSHSVSRRTSCHRRDSSSSSDHRPSPHNFRRSCLSNPDCGYKSTAYNPPHLCEDLLSRFLDCSQ